MNQLKKIFVNNDSSLVTVSAGNPISDPQAKWEYGTSEDLINQKFAVKEAEIDEKIEEQDELITGYDLRINLLQNDMIELDDKAYDASTYSGLGRKLLKKNMVNGVNTLTQDMINEPNTIYVIQYDYILEGSINIPANCVLDFQGGSIKYPGTTKIWFGVNHTRLIGEVSFSNNIHFIGSLDNDTIYINWFGAVGDGVTDCTAAIQRAIDVIQDTHTIHTITGYDGNYRITEPLDLTSIIGSKSRHCITIKGQSRPNPNVNKGFFIFGDTESSIIESLDTTYLILENLALIGGSNTKVGVVIGRGPDNNLPRTIIKNCYIKLSSNSSFNNSLGTIGLLVHDFEESVVSDTEIWANICLAETNNGTVIRSGINGDKVIDINESYPLTSYTYSFYHYPDKTFRNTSNTVMSFRDCRFCSYDGISPAVILIGSTSINMDHCFVQKSSSGSANTGNYSHAFEMRGVVNGKIDAAIEVFQTAIAIPTFIDQCNININMLGDNSLPLIAATRNSGTCANNNIIIRANVQVGQKLLDVSNTSAWNITNQLPFVNTDIKTNIKNTGLESYVKAFSLGSSIRFSNSTYKFKSNLNYSVVGSYNYSQLNSSVYIPALRLRIRTGKTNPWRNNITVKGIIKIGRSGYGNPEQTILYELPFEVLLRLSNANEGASLNPDAINTTSKCWFESPRILGANILTDFNPYAFRIASRSVDIGFTTSANPTSSENLQGIYCFVDSIITIDQTTTSIASYIGGDLVSPESYSEKWQLPSTYNKRPNIGDNSEKPNKPGIGSCYFDTSLNMPIWYNGNSSTGWVDATGTPV